MQRTITIVIIFFVCIILIAFAFALFFQPATVEKTVVRYNECVVLQNAKSGAIDCFGCSEANCKDASTDWTLYKEAGGATTYNCLADATGCQLAK